MSGAPAGAGGLVGDAASLLQVLFVDIALAGDNAVVVALAVAGLPPARRRWAVAAGVVGAVLTRALLGLVALRLLAIVGLLLAGGLLLLWVCWRMARELRAQYRGLPAPAAGSFGRVIARIVLADLSVSLDNVLAVTGAAGGRAWVLLVGLALSVALMGIAANLLARMLERWRWIGWAGLGMVLFVALRMIWEGAVEVLRAV